MNKGTMLRTSIALVAAIAMISIVMAGATGTEAIKERHELMEGTKDSMMDLVSIAKKQTPFDADVVQASGKAIADHLKKAAQLFPEGSEKGDAETWAKAEIWSDRDNFDMAMKNSIDAAGAMQSIESEAGFMPALGALGNSCKNCHDKYRRPKE